MSIIYFYHPLLFNNLNKNQKYFKLFSIKNFLIFSVILFAAKHTLRVVELVAKAEATPRRFGPLFFYEPFSNQ